MLPKSNFDWLTLASLWLAATIMAIKTGNLALISGAPLWLASDIWGYVPFALVTFFAIVAAFRARPSASALVAPSAKIKSPKREVGRKPPASDPVPEESRVFLAENIDPLKLVSLFDGKTSAHGKRAVEPYIGKWLRYRGPISNAFALTKSICIVFDFGYLMKLNATLSNDTDLLDVLHKDDVIEIIGKIATIDAVTVELDEVEITHR